MKVEKFWMVHGIGQRSPTFRHDSKAGAEREAQRLATQAPGVVFVVLTSKSAFVSQILPVAPVEITKHPGDETLPPDTEPLF